MQRSHPLLPVISKKGVQHRREVIPCDYQATNVRKQGSVRVDAPSTGRGEGFVVEAGSTSGGRGASGAGGENGAVGSLEGELDVDEGREGLDGAVVLRVV